MRSNIANAMFHRLPTHQTVAILGLDLARLRPVLHTNAESGILQSYGDVHTGG